MGKKEAKGEAKGPRILIFNNESRYMEDLERTVRTHAKKNAQGKVKVETAHVNEAEGKIKEGDVPYDLVILSGSFKRRYDDPNVQYVLKTIENHNKANPDNQIAVYGACLGHQAMIHYHGKGKAKFVDLGKYIKGDKEITLADGIKVRSHKHHKHAFKDAPNLEVIAESTVNDIDDNEHKIVESVKHEDRPYLSSQGHPSRPGHARDLLYLMLNNVYEKRKGPKKIRIRPKKAEEILSKYSGKAA